MPGAGIGGNADQTGMAEAVESGENVDIVTFHGFGKKAEAGFGLETEFICGRDCGGDCDCVCRQGESYGKAGGGC